MNQPPAEIRRLSKRRADEGFGVDGETVALQGDPLVIRASAFKVCLLLRVRHRVGLRVQDIGAMTVILPLRQNHSIALSILPEHDEAGERDLQNGTAGYWRS
jgi:hypothetical protein